MKKQKNIVILQNEETGEVYRTFYNDKGDKEPLKPKKKYSPKLRKHVEFKPVKKLKTKKK